MFEQSMIPKGKSKKWAWLLTLVVHVAVVGIIILIPLTYVSALPAPDLMSMLVAPPPPPPPPPPPAAVAPHRRATPVRQFEMNTLVEPTTIPKQIAIIKDLPAPDAVSEGVPGGVVGGVPGGVAGGVLGSILNSQSSVPPPPPPPPSPAKPSVATPKPAPRTIHVGGNVEAAMLVSGPKPDYPEVARQARIQGTVELKAIIGKDGKVQDLKVMNGNPLLVNAALDAVHKWVYRPTLLNGVPVNVATEIDVTFTLG